VSRYSANHGAAFRCSALLVGLAGLIAMMAAPSAAQQVDNEVGVAISAAGDIAVCPSPLRRGAGAATARLLDDLPGPILALGDLAYPDGSAEEFRDCYGPTWGRHRARTWPVPGNHDYRSRQGGPYYDYFGARAGERGRGWYSFDLDGWHLVALNSNLKRTLAAEQLAWLEADLAAAPARCLLAFWHHSHFSSGRHGDSQRMQAAFEILRRQGASILLTGHDHLYERLAPLDAAGRPDRHGVRVFVVGTGGAWPYEIERRRPHSEAASSGIAGVLRLLLAPGRYTWDFRPVAGKTFKDRGSAASR